MAILPYPGSGSTHLMYSLHHSGKLYYGSVIRRDQDKEHFPSVYCCKSLRSCVPGYIPHSTELDISIEFYISRRYFLTSQHSVSPSLYVCFSPRANTSSTLRIDRENLLPGVNTPPICYSHTTEALCYNTDASNILTDWVNQSKVAKLI